MNNTGRGNRISLQSMQEAWIMTDQRMLIVAIAGLVLALTAFAGGARADEHSGTWKLSPAKSKYSPGPGFKELTETIVLDENSYKVEANGTAADGTPVHIAFDAKFDGKDYPIRGAAWADEVSVKRTNRHTPQIIQKKGGQITMTITCQVSTDGQTRTCTLKGKNEQGHGVNNVVVFERQ
jgi:hypothetical protein